MVWKCGGSCAPNVDDGTWLCGVAGLQWCGGESVLDVVQVNDVSDDGARFGWCGVEEQGVAVLGEGQREERCTGQLGSSPSLDVLETERILPVGETYPLFHGGGLLVWDLGEGDCWGEGNWILEDGGGALEDSAAALVEE